MVYGVSDDVGDMVVDQRVHGLSAAALHAHQSSAPQHPKMLRDERLAHLEPLDQFVDVTGLRCQLDHDGQAGRRSEHPEQLAGRFVGLRCH